MKKLILIACAGLLLSTTGASAQGNRYAQQDKKEQKAIDKGTKKTIKEGNRAQRHMEKQNARQMKKLSKEDHKYNGKDPKTISIK